MHGHGKERAEADEVTPGSGGGDARHRDRDEAARLPLEEQQFDREQHRRERRREGCRHACRRGRHEQGLALGARQVQELGDERSERAAGHDDRTLGAEGAAGADGDSRGERLQDREPRLDAAAVDQNRLDRFRDAVAANPFRSVTRHEADDEAADDGDGDDEGAQHVGGGRRGRDAEAVEEEEVGEEVNQGQQADRDICADDPDRYGNEREQKKAGVGGEIAERVQGALVVLRRARPEGEHVFPLYEAGRARTVEY